MNAKPVGPIPPEFARQGELHFHIERARHLAEKHGTPLFVYDEWVLARRVAKFRQAMPAEVALHYAVKANPFPDLLRWMAERVDGFDVASIGEARLAKDHRNAVARMNEVSISFAGPGKTEGELLEACEAGVTINVESVTEAGRLVELHEHNQIGQFDFALRINPDFELRGSGMRMGGGARPFGIDIDQFELAYKMLNGRGDWQGFHIFAGSQSLDAEAIIEAQRSTVALAARLAERIGCPPPLVNLGGGFGVPYFAGDKPLDIERIGAALAETLAARPAILKETRFAIELGRWLVAEAGVYLTRILDRKTSHGEVFLVTDGGLHHQLAASGNFGTVVRRNYPLALAHDLAGAPEEVATVVGRLCTPLDRLGDRVALPRAKEGDLVAIFLAGAYGATASPSAFLGHPPAGEILVGSSPFALIAG